MKKTISIIALIIISLKLSAQKNDSIPLPIKMPDSVKCISVNDIKNYLNSIQDKVTVKSYIEFTNILQPLIDQANKEWIDKNTKKK